MYKNIPDPRCFWKTPRNHPDRLWTRPAGAGVKGCQAERCFNVIENSADLCRGTIFPTDVLASPAKSGAGAAWRRFGVRLPECTHRPCLTAGRDARVTAGPRKTRGWDCIVIASHQPAVFDILLGFCCAICGVRHAKCARVHVVR